VALMSLTRAPRAKYKIATTIVMPISPIFVLCDPLLDFEIASIESLQNLRAIHFVTLIAHTLPPRQIGSADFPDTAPTPLLTAMHDRVSGDHAAEVSACPARNTKWNCKRARTRRCTPVWHEMPRPESGRQHSTQLTLRSSIAISAVKLVVPLYWKRKIRFAGGVIVPPLVMSMLSKLHSTAPCAWPGSAPV
jgi:hypothetical protein